MVGKYAARITLPETVRLHPVFHVSLLEPAASDPYPGQRVPPLRPVIVEGEEEWEVEDILDARIRRGKPRYCVKWTGYDAPTWEDARGINGLQAVDRFHKLNPIKPGPLPEDEDGSDDDKDEGNRGRGRGGRRQGRDSSLGARA